MHDLRPISHLHQQEADVDKEIGEWLDASKINELHLCPRRYFYRYEEHLVPKTSEERHYANPMQYGIAIHAALASYYDGTGLDPVTCPCPSMEGCEFCHGQPIPRMGMLFLINYPFDPPIELDYNPRTADPRTRARGLEILHQYLERWGRESFEVLATEIPFAIEFFRNDPHEPIPKLLFTYVGRIDLIKKQDGQIFPKDHKSTTQFGQRFHNQWKLDLGQTGYMHAVANILGIPVEKAEINALRITTKIQQDESFLRIETTRNPEDFEEWEREVRAAFASIQRYRAEGFWPKHAPYACSAYNRTCEYYNLCTATCNARANIIEANFERREWNPTDVE